MLPAFFRVSSAAGRDRTKPFLPEGNGLAAEGSLLILFVRVVALSKERRFLRGASASVSAGDSKQIWH